MIETDDMPLDDEDVELEWDDEYWPEKYEDED